MQNASNKVKEIEPNFSFRIQILIKQIFQSLAGKQALLSKLPSKESGGAEEKWGTNEFKLTNEWALSDSNNYFSLFAYIQINSVPQGDKVFKSTVM